MNKEKQAWLYSFLNQVFGWSRFWTLRGRGKTINQANTLIMRSKIRGAKRWKILWRDKFTCYLCGKRYTARLLDIDHVKPLSKYWDNSEKNLKTACRWCNRKKGVKLM